MLAMNSLNSLFKHICQLQNKTQPPLEQRPPVHKESLNYSSSLLELTFHTCR